MSSRRAGTRHGASVVYDANAHREFVTGFRKRKQARRAKATRDIEAAEKQTRREERKRRRAVLRRTADRARGLYAESSDDEDDDERNSNPENPSRGAKVSRHSRTGAKATEKNTKKISQVYEGENDEYVTTTVTPMETFADANFSQRLPKNVTSHESTKRASRARDAGAATGKQDVETGPSGGRIEKKRTRSAAKKHSKAQRHSAVEKSRRARRELKVTKTARNST